VAQVVFPEAAVAAVAVAQRPAAQAA